MLYPLKFMPLYKSKVWGGNRIAALGFDYAPLPNCGEMWVLSGLKGNESVVADGPLAENNLAELLEVYMGDLVGEKNYEHFGDEFPLLIKVIDASDRLSIQVHPDDELARQRGMAGGKSEMWYVMQADTGAEIIDGFDSVVPKEMLAEYAATGNLEKNLHVEHPQKGDIYYIPAGRVHALGKGLLIAEIQQASDCTYRIYDYNRPDKDGHPAPARMRMSHQRRHLKGRVSLVKMQPSGIRNHRDAVHRTECHLRRLHRLVGRPDIPLDRGVRHPSDRLYQARKPAKPGPQHERSGMVGGHCSHGLSHHAIPPSRAAPMTPATPAPPARHRAGH